MEKKNMIKVTIPQGISYGVRDDISMDTDIYIEEEAYDKYISEGRTKIVKFDDDILFFTEEEYTKIEPFLKSVKENRNLMSDIKKIIEED